MSKHTVIKPEDFIGKLVRPKYGLCCDEDANVVVARSDLLTILAIKIGHTSVTVDVLLGSDRFDIVMDNVMQLYSWFEVLS